VSYPATLNDALIANRRDDRHIAYINDQTDERPISFAELYERALGVLRHLQAFGIRPGDELILFTNSNEQFVDGFWACLLGGIVPVPIAVGISDDHRHKLLAVFATLANPYVYTEDGLLQRLRNFGELQDLARPVEALIERSLRVEDVQSIAEPGSPVAAQAKDRAFIQFSSGSTGAPKGVVLTHANLMTNIRGIVEGAGITADDVALSWMPLTHDMGLIGLHLSMVVANVSHYIMDTRLFSRRPLAWMTRASEKQATILCSPNFGYKHFLRVYESKGLENLDLSRVKIIFNGAEPIAVPLCERFCAEMARFQMPAVSMRPVYGLAEASVAVTIPTPGVPYRTITANRHALKIGEPYQSCLPGSEDAVVLPTVGVPIYGTELRIADNEANVLPDGTVGHIQIRGGNVTAGYYQKAGIDRSPYTADGWLDTGDLGLMYDGELVVTGRYKEVIFANGQNYYPHDIENVVQEHANLELGKVVAVGARRAGAEEDELVIFVLYRADLDDFEPIANRVRRAVTEQTGLEVDEVVPINRVPKTTSGKITRRRLATDYEDGIYDEIVLSLHDLRQAHHRGATTAVTALEQILARICHEVVTDRELDPNDNFFEIGISSLALAEIHERLDELYPDLIEVSDFFDYPTVRELAGFLARKAEDT
jgi:acyl-CoA synthetase (AMP-forming)/AMP-acid ligase II/acyl carrier protein